jgi:hypothetical protein
MLLLEDEPRSFGSEKLTNRAATEFELETKVGHRKDIYN